MPELQSTANESQSYSPPIWLPGGNLQTIYPYAFKPVRLFNYRRERWELDDGDFVDVDWVDGAIDSPLVVFFNGFGNFPSRCLALAAVTLAVFPVIILSARSTTLKNTIGRVQSFIFAVVQGFLTAYHVPITPAILVKSIK